MRLVFTLYNLENQFFQKYIMNYKIRKLFSNRLVSRLCNPKNIYIYIYNFFKLLPNFINIQGWYKKDKNVFSRFAWGDTRTYRGAGRSNPSVHLCFSFIVVCVGPVYWASVSFVLHHRAATPHRLLLPAPPYLLHSPP